MMGEVNTQNMQSSFQEINNLCKVVSRWKNFKTNILTMPAPLNVKKYLNGSSESFGHMCCGFNITSILRSSALSEGLNN